MIRDVLMFEIRKNLDLRKFFVALKIFLKSTVLVTTKNMCKVLEVVINPR